ncbi:MAG: class I SAM-dependent methyltransferase [Planctomycetota bacterium]
MLPRELGNPKTGREVAIAERFWGSVEAEAALTRSLHFGLTESELVREQLGTEWDFFVAWRASNRRRIELAGREVARHLTQPSRVLEVGCACGQISREIAALGHTVTGIDLSHEAIAIGERILPEFGLPITLQQGDALNLPFAADSFDAVVSWDVIEHIPEQPRFLAEILRVLRPGGLLLVETDNDVRVQLGVWYRRLTCWAQGHNPFRWRHAYAGLEGGHCALVTPARLARMAARLGYQDVRTRYWGGPAFAPGYFAAPKFILQARKSSARSGA